MDDDDAGWAIELDEHSPVTDPQPQLGTADEPTQLMAVRVGRHSIERGLDTTLDLRVEPPHLSSRGGRDDDNPAAAQVNS
jgi:hypothetical protein